MSTRKRRSIPIVAGYDQAMSRFRIGLVIVLGIGIVVFVVGWLLRSTARRFFYPQPASMPASVEATLPGLLARLERVLSERAPTTHAALQPGLPLGRIRALESESGVTLTDELRTLYAWRNGLAEGSGTTLFSIHGFPSLERVIAERSAMAEQLQAATLLQRGFYSLSSGHRHSWIDLFPDGAGDGYFIDPQRDPAQGAVFYHFTEDGHYVFYRSLKDLIAAIVEGYESGVYAEGRTGPVSIETVTREMEIHRKYGSAR
jgi:cell wall assembly regulator SMI1